MSPKVESWIWFGCSRLHWTRPKQCIKGWKEVFFDGDLSYKVLYGSVILKRYSNNFCSNLCRFWAALNLAIILVRRFLRSILYGRWQSYTYCNCDKIVTFFTGRTTDNLFPVFNYFQLWFWQYEILGNHCQLALFTFVIYTVHNNVCVTQLTLRISDRLSNAWYRQVFVTLSLYCWVRQLTSGVVEV